MDLNDVKYKNAILYFIKYCNNQYLHATKLNKLLYYLDFINYRDREESVTGDIYIHNQYGPIPSNLLNILSEMKSDGDIDVTEEVFKDSHFKSFKLNADIDENVFSGEEKSLLRNICDEFLGWKTDKIVEQTHLEAPWFYSKPFEVVDYKYSSDIDFFND